MRNIILFAIVALVIAGVVPRFIDQAGSVGPAPATTAPAITASPTVSSGPRTVVLRPGDGGHFWVDGVIDGRRIPFVVDTGATTVSLTQQAAARLGIHPAQREYTGVSRTANGVIRVAPVTLGMVEIGGVTVRNVGATVRTDDGENLLGMSFLSRLRRFEFREGRLILEE